MSKQTTIHTTTNMTFANMTQKTRQLLLLLLWCNNNICGKAIKRHEMQLNDLNMNQFQSHWEKKSISFNTYDLLLLLRQKNGLSLHSVIKKMSLETRDDEIYVNFSSNIPINDNRIYTKRSCCPLFCHTQCAFWKRSLKVF